MGGARADADVSREAEFGGDGAHRVHAATGGEEVCGLGDKSNSEEKGDDGQCGTDPEDGLPGIEGGGDNAAEGGTEAIAGGVDGDGQAAEAQVGVFADEHGDTDKDAADANAGDEAAQQQQAKSRREGGEYEADEVNGERDRDEGGASKAVSQRGEEERAKADTDESGGQEPAEGRVRQCELFADGAGAEGHGHHVIAVEGIEEEGNGDDEPLACAHGGAVDEFADVHENLSADRAVSM